MGSTDRFLALVEGPEEELGRRLDEAALLIAAHANGTLDVDDYLGRLDRLAATCIDATANGVVMHVFGTLGFAGNTADYHDVRNSYLDQVIDRRLGIPITLAVVAISVARRVGVTLEPVGMPGRFLVRHRLLDGTGPPVLIDPFVGEIVSASVCQDRFRELFGRTAAWEDSYLDPTPPRAVVARILANLRSVALGRGDLALLEWVVRLRGLIPGTDPEDTRDLRREVMRRRADLN